MTRDEKIRAIVDAMELYEQIDMQLLAAREHCVSTMQIAQDDLKQRYGQVFSAHAIAQLDALSAQFGKVLADMWDSEAFLEVFVSEYGRGMSDDDLDQILAYYTSAAGRKDVRSAKSAIAMTMGEMLALRRDQYEPALRAYSDQVDRILAASGEPDA